MPPDPVWLDGVETVESQRFIALQRKGVPGIQGPVGSSGQTPSCAFLDNIKGVMNIVVETLRANATESGETLPPMVENLSQLMKDLGNAAWAVGR